LTRRKRGFNHFLFLLHKGAVQRTSPSSPNAYNETA
jgi:hypothetical protein